MEVITNVNMCGVCRMRIAVVMVAVRQRLCVCVCVCGSEVEPALCVCACVFAMWTQLAAQKLLRADQKKYKNSTSREKKCGLFE